MLEFPFGISVLPRDSFRLAPIQCHREHDVQTHTIKPEQYFESYLKDQTHMLREYRMLQRDSKGEKIETPLVVRTPIVEFCDTNPK